MVFFVVPAIFIKFRFQTKWAIAFWAIISLSFYLRQAADIIPSAEIISFIVHDNTERNLNIKEMVALFSLALMIGYMNQYNIIDKILSVAAMCHNSFVRDWILILFYVFSISGSIFLICSLIVNPIQCIVRALSRMLARCKLQNLEHFEAKIEQCLSSSNNTYTLAEYVIELSKKSPLIVKIILWLCVPIAIVLNAIYICVRLFAEIIIQILWFIYVIIKQIAHLLTRSCAWILALTDKSVVLISFRIAIILGFGGTVIINYYEPFLTNLEESCSVLEFISSSIIIPVIFDWIFSYKKTKELTGSQAQYTN